MKHKNTALLALWLAATLLPAQGQQPTTNRLRDSLTTLNTLIAANPHSADLRLRKAALNIELNQWEYAIEEYGRVLQQDPTNLTARFFRAYAHNHLRHFDAARDDYEHFLSIVPRHFEARLGLAMVKRNQGRTIEAADEFNRLVEQYPDSALAYAVRADFEDEQGQLDLARYDYQQALRLHPANAEYRVALQRLEKKKKR